MQYLYIIIYWENFSVHLDEETLMTLDSVIGIMNFCYFGYCQFGHGLIMCAAKDPMHNVITTCADLFLVGESLGKVSWFCQKICKTYVIFLQFFRFDFLLINMAKRYLHGEGRSW